MMKPSLAALLVDIDRIGPLAIARIERLQNINAELLAALEELAVLGEEGMPPGYTQWKVAQVARAAIARAKAED